ncbi:MAG: CHAT domain-containing protein, partial [Cyanobacteria bacterium J06631_2]
MTTKILVLSSNPQATEQLRLNREFSEIENARESSRNKDQFTVLRVAQARVDHLQREILETKARIVHFCGHGLGNQGLALETRSGQQQLVSNQALADLFELVAHQVECVILNACFSKAQAAVVHDHINYVIGTENAIKDEAAIAFSQGFYAGLFSGASIERAYELGKNNIQLEIYRDQSQQDQSQQDQSQHRKLIPVDTAARELPESEIFTFLIKNPLSPIASKQPEAAHQNTPSNLNRQGSANFIGREKEVKKLHQLLEENEQRNISAIAGMGGIGKTELA